MKISLCLCGCNQEVNIGKNWIVGHNARCQIRKSMSEETKKKISAANKKKAEETSKKVSIIVKKAWANNSQRREKQSGENNSNWKGGSSFEPYCYKFNKSLKEIIRKRDNYTCQECGAIQDDISLCMHHIHYDKPNCNPDLITLCFRCSSTANFNRDYWEENFMTKLHERFGLNKHLNYEGDI